MNCCAHYALQSDQIYLAWWSIPCSRSISIESSTGHERGVPGTWECLGWEDIFCDPQEVAGKPHGKCSGCTNTAVRCSPRHSRLSHSWRYHSRMMKLDRCRTRRRQSLLRPTQVVSGSHTLFASMGYDPTGLVLRRKTSGSMGACSC